MCIYVVVKCIRRLVKLSIFGSTKQNATPHESIGVSPSQLLFGNAVHLDHSLLSNDGRVTQTPISTTYQNLVDKMGALLV